MSKHVLWVTGPSGSGKSELIKRLREKQLANTFDLDFVGYRLTDGDWQEWNIPVGIFKVLEGIHTVTGRSFVAVGCDSNPDQLRYAAIRAGFKPVVLLPPVRVLELQRGKRGDDREKINESEQSLIDWKAHAARWGADVYQDIETVISTFFK